MYNIYYHISLSSLNDQARMVLYSHSTEESSLKKLRLGKLGKVIKNRADLETEPVDSKIYACSTKSYSLSMTLLSQEDKSTRKN